jgi:hypothetical protein
VFALQGRKNTRDGYLQSAALSQKDPAVSPRDLYVRQLFGSVWADCTSEPDFLKTAISASRLVITTIAWPTCLNMSEISLWRCFNSSANGIAQQPFLSCPFIHPTVIYDPCERMVGKRPPQWVNDIISTTTIMPLSAPRIGAACVCMSFKER